MIVSLVRSVGAVVLGLAVALMLIVGVEFFSSIVHPFPPGVDPTNMEVCRQHVAKYPAWVLAVAALAWVVTTFVSSWLTTRLGTGRHGTHGFVVGLILLALAIMNMSLLPYPVWFWAANLIGFPLGFYWGAKLGAPASSPVPLP